MLQQNNHRLDSYRPNYVKSTKKMNAIQYKYMEIYTTKSVLNYTCKCIRVPKNNNRVLRYTNLPDKLHVHFNLFTYMKSNCNSNHLNMKRNDNSN